MTRIVLVVDDEPHVRDGIAELTALGCEVITAGNGSEALEKLKGEPRIRRRVRSSRPRRARSPATSARCRSAAHKLF